MARPPRSPSELVDHLLETDPELKGLFEKIHRQQHRLKAAIERRHYRLYLQLEDTMNEMWFGLIERVQALALRRRRRLGRSSTAAR